MDVAREQPGADLLLKIIDSPAHDVDGQLKPLSRGSEAPATDHLQENPCCVPIGAATGSCPIVFLLGNAPFQNQTHTYPFLRAKLARISGELQPWRVQIYAF